MMTNSEINAYVNKAGKKKGPTGFMGLEKLMANLSKEIKGIKGRTMKGYIEVAILIRRSVETSAPVVPVDWGNLRNSWFTTTGKAESSGSFKGPKSGELSTRHDTVKSKYGTEAEKDSEPMMILGFSANYASFVHENMEAHYRRPGSGPKFLENSIEHNKQKILYLLKKNAEIK
jgi:hypothetical protein